MIIKRNRSFSPHALFRLLGTIIVCYAFIQVLTILLSLIHVVISQFIAVLILGVSIAFSLLVARRCYSSEANENDSNESGSPSGKKFTWLLTILLLLLIVSAVNASLHPYILADCATYHLPAIHFWGEKGYVHWIDLKPAELYYTDFFINGYPKAAELMSYIVAHATGIAETVHLLNLWFLLIGIAGVTLITRILGASGTISFSAGLLYGLSPVNIVQLNGTYVDSAFASIIVAALAIMTYLVRYYEKLSNIRYPIIVFGASLGLLLGIKESGALYAGIIGIALLIMLEQKRRKVQPKIRRKEKYQTLICFLIIVITAFSISGYWYVRNFIHTGNPVYPMAFKVGNIIQLPGLPLEFIMNEKANTPPIFASWPKWRRVAYTWMQGGLNHWPLSLCSVGGRLGGLGLIWILGCLPSIIFLMLQSRKPANRGYVVPGALFFVGAIAFLMTPMHWWARYTVWLLGIGLPCLLYVLEKSLFSRVRKMIIAWMILLLLLSFVEILICNSWISCADGFDWYGGMNPFPKQTKIAVERLSFKRRFTLSQNADMEQMYSLINRDFKSVALGPLKGGGVLPNTINWMFGMLSDPLGRRKIYLLRGNSRITVKNLDKLIKTKNLHYLIWDANISYPEQFDRLSIWQKSIGSFRLFGFKNI